LWMLARQWQLGEFVGEDIGSPVYAALRIDCSPLTRYLPGQLPEAFYTNNTPSVGRKLPRDVPLETLVERSVVREPTSSRPRLAAEAGLQLLRQLVAAGVGGLRPAVSARFALQAAAVSLPLPDPDTQRFLDVVGGRVPDGTLVADILSAIAAGTTPSTLREPLRTKVPEWQSWQASLAAADRTNLDKALVSWSEWYANLASEPSSTTGESAWLPDRLEYAAAVAAPTPEGEVVLTLGEYQDAGLDWYSFDAVNGGSLGAVRSDLNNFDRERENVHRTVIPAPVYFPGMPALRYWELEDARVDFGSVAAGPQQLAHLLLVEFGLVSGDDWFMIPVEVPVGSLCRTRWLVVTDTFGVRTLIPSAREVDGGAAQAQLPWDMFRLSLTPRKVSTGTRPMPDMLFLAPSLGPSLLGTTLEEVMLLRDELAHMAWAVERIVESPSGVPLDRAVAYQVQQAENPPAPSTVAGVDPTVEWAYRLSTPPPDYWLPLIPVRVTSDTAIHLRRSGRPLGRLMEPDRDPSSPNALDIHEEEVAREGARVTRGFQYARWIDGGTFLWMARAKGSGRGEGSSGLRFDILEAVSPTSGPPAMQLGVRSTLGVDAVARRLFGV
jgi:hypothetical protein